MSSEPIDEFAAFEAMSEEELDAALSEGEQAELGPSLRLILAPPDDLTDRVSREVAQSLLRQETMTALTDLLGLGVATARVMFDMDEEPFDDG